MVTPSEVKKASKKLENQNIKFRAFLKNRADIDELDAHFLKLHNELFVPYDCGQCRNCCKEYNTSLGDDEIAAISQFLGQTKDDFINNYLRLNPMDGGYETKEKPCCFLTGGGQCRIQECRPNSCRDFPYTNQPERLFSLLGILGHAEVCPVVFEILERLKKIYHFRNRTY
ncbi:MAG: YkgJ family cysteine cluster protein [Peptococcaceae bacterium]|jgi:Fe-S-cluster containining protein|nr:YkgJ family cysteine cluster protein [Peptococcaceae bacterium]